MDRMYAMAFTLLLAGAAHAQQTSRDFLSVLNACVSAGRTAAECSGWAARSTGATRLYVNYRLDLTGREPATRDVEICNWKPGGYCDLYSCSENGDKSICNLVGYCFHDDDNGESFCADD